MAEQAVGLFSEEKFVEGYDLLKPYWPLPAAEVDNMANQTLQKFQNHAIRWVFVLYKPQKRWMINGVFFDDQLKELFP